MIRCTTDHQALYTDPATGKRSRTPIIAWDSNGDTLDRLHRSLTDGDPRG